MKPCPYCAETIQDAAAKCRFCGEWLDPSKRPEWSGEPVAPKAAAPAPRPVPTPFTPVAAPAPEAAPAPVAAAVPLRAEPRVLAAFDPPGQPTQHTETGRAAQPQARGRTEQSWEAPAWLAQEHAQQAGSSRDSADSTGGLSAAANATQAEAPVRTSLEDVALRMQRIKASAAAVRNAVTAEAAATPRPADNAAFAVEDPDESARTMVDGPAQRARVVARAAAEAAAAEVERDPDFAAAPMPAMARDLLGDDFDDDFDGDDDVHAQAARGGDLDDELDDDGFKHPAFGDGFDEDLDDEFEDDDLGDFGDVGAARPLPWKPIAAGAGVVLVAGLAIFWSRIFPPTPDDGAAAVEQSAETSDANEGKSVAKGSVAAPEDVKPAVPGAGQPVTPEAAPAAVASPIPTDELGAPIDPAANPAVAGVDPAVAGVDPAGAPAPTDAAEGAGLGATPTLPPAAALPPPAAGAGPAASLDPASLAQLEEARTLYRKGGKSRLRQANEILETILASRPNHPDALVVTAQVKLELGQPEDALATAQRCTQVAPEMADCWLTIGVLQQDGKEKESAAQAYERYLALAPEGAYAGQVRKQLKRLR